MSPPGEGRHFPVFGGFELSARQGGDFGSESAVRSAGAPVLISSQCLGMLIRVFRPLLWSQTASPGERPGAFGNHVLCAEPRAGGCALAGPAVRWLPCRGCRCERLRHQAEGSEVRGAVQGEVWLLHHCSPVAALCQTRPAPLSGAQCQGSCQYMKQIRLLNHLKSRCPCPAPQGRLLGACGAGTSVPLDSQGSGQGGAPVTCREPGMRDAGCGCGAWWGAGWHPHWGALCP